MADFKQHGYIVIRPHEIESAAFQFEQKDLTVDEQKLAILIYAHGKVVEETRMLCELNRFAIPQWAKREIRSLEQIATDLQKESKPFSKERVDTGTTSINTSVQPGGSDIAGEPERASGRKPDTSARSGRSKK